MKEYGFMKKILILFVCVMLLFSGCAKVDDSADTKHPTEESAAPTETTKPVTEESTAPTETTDPVTEPPTQPTEPPSEEEYFHSLLTDEYWYCRALGCTFTKPEEINAKFYFYAGLDIEDRLSSSTFNDAEIAFLSEQWKDPYGEDAWKNAHKLPTAKIEEALSILNVGLADITIPDEWVYFEQTDAYYDLRYDFYGVVGVTIKDVVTAGDTVQVFWTTEMVNNTFTGELMRNPKMVISLQRLEDGSYRVLSNMPVQ